MDRRICSALTQVFSGQVVSCLMFYNSSDKRTRFLPNMHMYAKMCVASTGFPIGPRGDWHKKNRGPMNMQRNPLKLQAAAVGERTSVRRERRVQSGLEHGQARQVVLRAVLFSSLFKQHMYVCVSSLRSRAVRCERVATQGRRGRPPCVWACGRACLCGGRVVHPRRGYMYVCTSLLSEKMKCLNWW